MSRNIVYSNKWEKDVKALRSNEQFAKKKKELLDCINKIANDEALSANYDNHKMARWTLDYKDMYNFHLAPNICVIYDLREPGIVRFVRIGSHPHLGLTEGV